MVVASADEDVAGDGASVVGATDTTGGASELDVGLTTAATVVDAPLFETAMLS